MCDHVSLLWKKKWEKTVWLTEKFHRKTQISIGGMAFLHQYSNVFFFFFCKTTHRPSFLYICPWRRQVFLFFFFAYEKSETQKVSKRQSLAFQLGYFWLLGQYFLSLLMMLCLVPWIRVEFRPRYLRLGHWLTSKDGGLPVCTSLTILFWPVNDHAIIVIKHFDYCFCFYINI